MNKSKYLILKTDIQVSLKKASNLLIVTNIILQRSNSRLFESLMDNPKAALTLLSLFYPFDGVVIDNFADILNFNELSDGIYIRWDNALIKKFKDEWNWQYLSGNKALPWSNALIEEYKYKWDYR